MGQNIRCNSEEITKTKNLVTTNKIGFILISLHCCKLFVQKGLSKLLFKHLSEKPLSSGSNFSNFGMYDEINVFISQ